MRWLVLVFCLFHSWIVFGNLNQKKSIKAAYITEKITIDGELNEDAWQNAEPGNHFWQNSPYDTAEARSQTEVKVCFDDQTIYFSAVCYNSSQKEYIVQSLKRDFSFPRNDAFQVIFDPYGDNTNGFSFCVNALGAQREGVITNGGNWGVTTNWDNKWYSEVKNYIDKWVVEIAIPFKSIRFTQGSTVWHVNFARNDLKINEMSTWNPVPRNFNVATLTYCGNLMFEKPLNKTGTNVSLIPYALGKFSGDYTDSIPQEKWSGNVGGDAKIAVTSSLNLDLTINPDFSQVDVDQQVANISRFSIYYPEKRQFFLENADLFGRLGFSKIRPFFSRKIGIAYNPNTGIYEQIPIMAGARLSGKVNNDLRIGFLNITTPQNRNLNLPVTNYTVAVAQQQVGSNSNITFSLVNKQDLGNDSTAEIYVNPNHFQRIAGVDFNFASKDNKWKGIAFIHQQFSPQPKGNEGANATFLYYNTQNWQIAWNHEYVGKNYNPEVGFVPRNDHIRFEPSISYKWYPKKQNIISNSISIGPDYYFVSDMSYVKDMDVTVSFSKNYFSTSFWQISFSHLYTRLTFDFDPSGVYDTVLHAGDAFAYDRLSFYYNSDGRKKLSFSASGDYGTYYNGNRLAFSLSATFRAQPWGRFSLNFNQQNIYMPEPFTTAFYSVFGPKIEFSFTRNLFWTTYVQYNQKSNNLNVNSRLQWRFKPMSDLFIVYTDNYFTEARFNQFDDLAFTPQYKKNVALIVKLVYWLNI